MFVKTTSPPAGVPVTSKRRMTLEDALSTEAMYCVFVAVSE